MDIHGSVRITDVGPRDGLQNEQQSIPLDDKVALVDRLARSGVAEVEVSSFVNPKLVPQLSDAAEVFKGIDRVPGVVYSALVPNEQGWNRAVEAGVDKIAVFTTASETFADRNTNCTIKESLDRFAPVLQEAGRTGIPVRGYVSCAVACPYEGRIEPRQVAGIVSSLLELGVNEIDLGDTIGVATPADIEQLLEACEPHVKASEVTLHLHDTGRGALACCLHALQLGVRSFDTSCGGLGGCPFAPGASGNLATEDLVGLCRMLGVETGVDLQAVAEASGMIERVLGRDLACRGRALAGRTQS